MTKHGPNLGPRRARWRYRVVLVDREGHILETLALFATEEEAYYHAREVARWCRWDRTQRVEVRDRTCTYGATLARYL